MRMIVIRIIVVCLTLLALTILVMMLLMWVERVLGIAGFQSPLSIAGGVPLLVAGIFLRGWTAYTFYDHSLRVYELRSQHTLMRRGPFAYSRNPLYIATALVILGCALLLGSQIGVLLAFLSLLFWHVWVRCVEERSLGARFGEDYRAYKQRTPRWIAWPQ